MPDYQMPGRNELTNMNDAFGKRNAVQQAILDRHAARNDGGSLKQSGQAQMAKSSAAEKLDSFIQK